METKDGRRSRVPAGTFGSSQPPPVPSGPPPAPPTQPKRPDADEGRRFQSTLVGAAALARAAVVEHAAQTPDAEPRKPFPSTLVGQPSSVPLPPSPVAPVPVAPVLAPPRWRGARAYLEGAEPKPHMSSIPTPPPISLPPNRSGAPTPSSKVTTKLGLPQAVAQSAPAPKPPHAAIGDAIQQMLDGQTSIPIEVEELAPDAFQEISPEGLALDLVIDGFSAAEPAPPPVSIRAAAPSHAPISARPQHVSHAAPPPARLPTEPGLPSERPDAQAAPRAVFASTAAPASKRFESPVPAARSAPVRKAAQSPVPAPPASAAMQRVQRRGDSNAGLGILLVAAIVVIGGGGWFLTRGGYRRPVSVAAVQPPSTIAAVAAPAATPEAAAQVQVPVPAAPPADDTAAPVAASAKNLGTEGDARPSKPVSARPRADSRPDTDVIVPTAPDVVIRSAPTTQVAPTSQLTPKADDAKEPAFQPSAPLPSPPLGEMKEIPGRDDVLAALDPLRSAISNCVHGQRGVAQLDITVAGTGLVAYAVVGGDFAGTPEGSCVARVARTARFVPFSKPRFRVIFPFSL